MLISSLILSFFKRFKKLFIFFVKSAIILAFSIPICLIPYEKINLSNVNFMRIDDDLDSIDASEWNLFSGKKSKKNIQKFSPITLKCIL